MIGLTNADIAALSKEEQDLAKALGLSAGPWKRTRKSHPKCTSGDPYILVVNTSCRLCSFSHARTFVMIKECGFLSSEEIAEVPSKEGLKNMKVKSSSRTVRHCSNCYSYLDNLPRKELVQRFLSYINDYRNFLS